MAWIENGNSARQRPTRRFGSSGTSRNTLTTKTTAFLGLVLLLFLPTVDSETVAVDMGTTLVAVKFRDGVILGADTRTSGGVMVVHRFAHKLVPLSDTIAVGRTGSSADTQLTTNIRARQAHDQHWHRYGTAPSVAQMAHWLRDSVYQSLKSSQGEAVIGLLVAGYCKKTSRPRIFSIAPSGAMVEERGSYAASGSGSTFCMGYLDHHCCLGGTGTSLMDETTAVEMCRRAIELAVYRDGSSGGFIRMYVMTASGRRELTIFPESTTNSNEPLVGFATAVRSSNNND